MTSVGAPVVGDRARPCARTSAVRVPRAQRRLDGGLDRRAVHAAGRSRAGRPRRRRRRPRPWRPWRRSTSSTSGSPPAGSRRAPRGPRRARRGDARPSAAHQPRRRHVLRRHARATARRAGRDELLVADEPEPLAAVSTSLSPRPDRLTRSTASGPSSRPTCERAGQRVRALDGRDDALGAAEQRERVHRLGVGHRPVRRAAGVVQPGVLGPDAGVVEAGRDRVRLDRLARPRPAARRSASRAARPATRR